MTDVAVGREPEWRATQEDVFMLGFIIDDGRAHRAGDRDHDSRGSR